VYRNYKASQIIINFQEEQGTPSLKEISREMQANIVV